MDFYQKGKEDVLQSVQSSDKGLTDVEVNSRLERDGYNEIKDKEKVPTWKLFLETFKGLDGCRFVNCGWCPTYSW